MGAGDYVNFGGEKQRNMMGNAMMNRSFDQYSYKKVLSKGTHKINGKKYYVKDNLYDVVPKGMNKKIINSSLKMVQYILTTIAIFLQKMMDLQKLK